MSRTYDDVRRLVERRALTLFSESMPDVHTTPTVFTSLIPDRLLDERGSRLESGLGTREWYLLTDEPLGEWGEELRGDLGILIVLVDDLPRKRRDLRRFVRGAEELYASVPIMTGSGTVVTTGYRE